MAERLYADVGLNKREAKEFVDAFFDVLREALEQGRQVKLSGFGNFDLRRKNQRPGRNPKTGEEIPISARTVVTCVGANGPERATTKAKPMTSAAAKRARPSLRLNRLPGFMTAPPVRPGRGPGRLRPGAPGPHPSRSASTV